MCRVLLLAEGQTEEGFARSVLAPHLGSKNVFLYARSVETRSRRKGLKRGGLSSYAKFASDLERWMKEEPQPDVMFTSMLDLYALPDDFPGFADAQKLADPYEKVAALEAALGAAIEDPRFVPYIQLHEFEALLFTDPGEFEWRYIEHEENIERLVQVAGSFGNPELIDEGTETAPSKRIIAEIPEFGHQKASVGPIVAGKIGLTNLRAACSHFDSWVKRLEDL